ncbi:MAG: RluA family pseudouridine synthase [Clostridiales bacterium]|nr:RluA family pseudouridine synthase [Clostridiales bacterium]
MNRIIVNDTEAGGRLDKYLTRYMPLAPKNFLYKMLRLKRIKLNAARADGNEILRGGDEVFFYLADETIQKFRLEQTQSRQSESLQIQSQQIGSRQIGSQQIGSRHIQSQHRDIRLDAPPLPVLCLPRRLPSVEIIFEDENILVVNKPAGLMTHSANSGAKDDLVSLIADYLRDQPLSPVFTPSVSNRLDRNTSGIVCCGKNPVAVRSLNNMFASHAVAKTYLAVCVGSIRETLVLTGSIAKDAKTNRSHVVNSDDMDTPFIKRIETRVDPLAWGEGLTLLSIVIITGRSHQIRAHLQSIGHPIVGDFKYGNASLNNKYHLPHQLLHAHTIQFSQQSGSLSPYYQRVWTASPDEIFCQFVSDHIEKGTSYL